VPVDWQQHLERNRRANHDGSSPTAPNHDRAVLDPSHNGGAVDHSLCATTRHYRHAAHADEFYCERDVRGNHNGPYELGVIFAT